MSSPVTAQQREPSPAERGLGKWPGGRRRHQRARRRVRSPSRNRRVKGRFRTPEIGWHHEACSRSRPNHGMRALFFSPAPGRMGGGIPWKALCRGRSQTGLTIPIAELDAKRILRLRAELGCFAPGRVTFCADRKSPKSCQRWEGFRVPYPFCPFGTFPPDRGNRPPPFEIPPP